MKSVATANLARRAQRNAKKRHPGSATASVDFPDPDSPRMLAEDAERFALPHRYRHALRERSSPLGDRNADARHTIRRASCVGQPVIAMPTVRPRALCATQ
ncbi:MULTISPECIES: hypothetical protein [Burkholderia]|uniref:hypothetical protein n=1 Tax=Burkholderia TaxID=32008 RepID=UPI001FC825BD|nr:MULTISPECIES: hypothetical protein [Burkholderia]